MNEFKLSSDVYINIKETASELSVSPATIRNWMKAGRIAYAKRIGNTLLFKKSDVETIKEAIYTGDSQRLKSRRNKKAVMGRFIPTEYVSSSIYVTIAEYLLTRISEKELEEGLAPAPILYEVVLNLLVAKGQIQLSNPLYHKSLTEAVLEKQLCLQNFETPLNNLFIPDSSLTNEICEILREIRSLNIPFIEGEDLLGLLYMSLSSLSKRKNNGAYYTPKNIVEMLVDRCLDGFDDDATLKIVDPCCGSGNFLIRLFLVLKKRLLKKGQDLIDVEIKLLAALCGYDIDPMAAAIAKLNLILLLETAIEETPSIQCQNALDSEGPAYDLVIGNPPWGYSYDDSECIDLKKRFTTAKGTLESYCLFIEYGINQLRPGGHLAYVLPESLLNVQIHEPARQLLMESSEITHIDVLGHRFSKVFAPSILLTARKALFPSIENQIIIHHDGDEYAVSQRRFASTTGTIFNIKATEHEELICEHMKLIEGVQYLKGQATFALGIVTGDNEYFLQNNPTAGSESIIKGGNVFKYHIEIGEVYLVFDPKQFQQVAPEKWYRAPEKLIYRFINEQLVFAYDNRGLLSLNSANIVIPRIPDTSIKYILAVLNSRAAQFFHQVSFDSVKVLKRHIESIPIPKCTKVQEKTIINLVDQLLEEKNPDERHNLYEMIDSMVMSLYDFSQADRDAIYKKTKQIKFL